MCEKKYYIFIRAMLQTHLNMQFHLKKIIAFLLIVNLTSSNLNSQNKIGAIGGINISNVKFSNGNETLVTSNYFTGLSFDFTLKDKWKLENNLTFSKRGYVNKNGIRYKVVLSYIDFQTLVKYSYSNNFYILSGSGLAFLADIKRLPASPTFDPVMDDLDFHLDFGIEYKIFRNINLHLIYLHGLLGKIKNRNIQCGFLIKFNTINCLL